MSRIRVLLRVASCMALSAGGARAQQLEPSPPHVDVWLSGGIGGARIGAYPGQLVVQTSAWTAVGHWLFGVRRAHVLEGETTRWTSADEGALLGGFRLTADRSVGGVTIGGATLAFAAGPSRVRIYDKQDYNPSTIDRGAGTGLGLHVEAMVHMRMIGLGFTAFGVEAPNRSFNAIALALSLGKIH